MRLNLEQDQSFNFYCPKKYAYLVTEGLRMLKVDPLIAMTAGDHLLANKQKAVALFELLFDTRKLSIQHDTEMIVFPLATMQEVGLVGAGLAKAAEYRAYLLTTRPERVIYDQTLDAIIAAAEGASLLLPGVFVPAVKPVNPE